VINRASGSTSTPCVAHDATSGYLAAGSTKGGANVEMSLYDPGVTPSVASVSLVTSGGLVQPPAYQGIPLQAGGVVVLNVGNFVVNRSVVASVVNALGGHIVVGALESVGGANAAAPTLLTASPRPSATWYFSGAPAGASTRQFFYVLNPGPKRAVVQGEVASASGSASLRVVAAPGGVSLVGLAPDVSPDALRWVSFATSAKTPVVIARETTVLTAVPAAALAKKPSRSAVALALPALSGALFLLAQDPRDLFVDDPARVLGVVPGVHEVLAEEDHALRAPGHRADAVGHAPLADHLAGELGVALQVVARPGREVAVDEELGDPSAHAHGERVLDVLARVDVALLEGQLLGDAERHAGRDDAHLEQRVGVREHVGEHRVAGLVEGDALLLGSESTRLSRCWPMSTRSRAASKSRISTTGCRGARRAAPPR
jgi:hypothetical protein